MVILLFSAHSIFGEDALTNISIEKVDPLDPSSAINGHIRVRAKSQGMALSLGMFSYSPLTVVVLGDKISTAQRKKAGEVAA